MAAPPGLRTRWDWIAGSALITIAGAVLVYTWFAVSGSRTISGELSYIVSGGLGGLLLLGLGAVLVVTAGLADEWRKLNRVEDAMPFPAAGERPGVASLIGRARLIAALGLLVSLAFVIPTWYTVSGDPDPKPGLDAVPWAVAGVTIGGFVAALATMSVQRRIQARKRALFAPWAAARSAVGAPGTMDSAAGPQPGSVLISPELTRFHRPGCPALRGVATRAVETRHIPGSLEPCELCEADAVTREERQWTSVAG